MRNASKLLALVLAFAMVLSLVPVTSAQTVHTCGIEDYPEIELDVETTVAITTSGETVYFRFTPKVTAEYTFASHDENRVWPADPQGYLYDAEMNLLAKHEDNGYDPNLGFNDLNFTLVYTMEAGTTYILATNLYNQYRKGVEFTVTLTGELPPEHNYVGVVTTEPTCDSDGLMTYTCSECGDSYTEVIPGGHIFENGFCTRCGAENIRTGVCGDNLTWKLNGTGTMTISGTGSMYDYTRYGETVAPWADLLSEITTLILEDGVTSVGSFAFMGAASLASVTMPDTLTTVNESAFRDCAALSTVDFSANLTTISGYAFMNCAALTAADLPLIQTIGNSAFYNCASLSELNLGEVLTAIDTLAFSGCASLTEVSMPDTVTAMGSDVFSYCTSLTTAKLSDGLTSLPTNTFESCHALTDVTIPQYLTTIGSRCFIDCYALEGVDLPFSTIAIGSYAFSGCTSLTSMNFPLALNYVGYFAFNNCTGLGNMEFPPNLTYFTGGCFYGCTGLTEIHFPEGTFYVDDDAFAGCTNIRKIVFNCSAEGLTIYGTAFTDVTADVWYPADDTTWTTDYTLNYGGLLTWHAMCADHSFGKWTPVEEATCTECGVDERVCADCAWTETRVSDPAGHIWDDGVKQEDGNTLFTCRICGETELRLVNPFTDVPADEWYFDPVMWAVGNGITTGATETTFNPNGSLLRAQVVTMLWRHAGEPAVEGVENPFTDISESDWYYTAVLWAVEKGITTGATETTFNPMGNTNRAQAITFLWRYLEQPESTGSNDFTDVEAGQWYEAAINWAVANGVTNGKAGTTEFGINDNCNRAHMVTFMYRALAK